MRFARDAVSLPERGTMSRTLYDLAGARNDVRFSPYCWRIKMALKHKGREWQEVPWRFTPRCMSERGSRQAIRRAARI